MAEHWISSAEAFDLITHRYDLSGRYADLEVCRAVVEDALLKRLSSAALRARATKGRMSSGDPFALEEEFAFENDPIPAAFWSGLRRSEDTDRVIDWVLGDFSFAVGYNENCAYGEAFGVLFEAAGIPGADALLQTESSPSLGSQEGGMLPCIRWQPSALHRETPQWKSFSSRSWKPPPR